MVGQQRIMGDLKSQSHGPGRSEEAATGEAENERETEVRGLQQQEATDCLSPLLVQLQEEHEAMEARVRQCLGTLQEARGTAESQRNGPENRQGQSEEVLTKLRELKVLLESVQETAFRCRLTICRGGSHSRVPDADNTYAGWESPREDSAQQARDEDATDMSWDNYEKEKAFLTFKGDVECIVQQLEMEKRAVKRKAKELEEVKRAQKALKEKRRKSRKRLVDPFCFGDPLEREDPEMVGGRQPHRPYHALSERPIVVEPPLEEGPDGPSQTPPGEWPLEPKRRQTGRDSREKRAVNLSDLAELMKVLLRENNQESERNLVEHFRRLQGALQGGNIQLQFSEEEEGTSAGGEHTKSALDGRYAVSELEITKRKLTDVQRNIKKLISSLAAAEKESEASRLQAELLTGELEEKESLHEAECEELRADMRCASQQQTALKRRVNSLDADKEELNDELRQVKAFTVLILSISTDQS